MNSLFVVVVAVAVIGGAIWAFTRKNKPSSGISGTPYDTTPGGNGTIIPPRDGENQF